MKYKHYIQQIFQPDRNNINNGYLVRSLYFDTFYDKDFSEKEEGIEIRKKIRLRIYSPTDSYASLEMKQKQGIYQMKRSLKIKKEDAIKLIAGNYNPLLQYHSSFAGECYTIMMTQMYRPKSVVEYRREAYIADGNETRITFDTNIRASEGNLDLFRTSLPLTPVLNPMFMVLEVKYQGFLLSYIKDTLQQCSKSELSVSKYSLSRQLGYNYKV